MPYLFIIFFLLEVLSIVIVSNSLGVLVTFILIAIVACIGVFMLRHIGLAAVLLSLEVFRHRQSGLSFYQMLYPIRYTFAALCFLSPGFFSDAIGIFLILPFRFSSNSSENTKFYQEKTNNYINDDIIDGEYREVKQDRVKE